MCVRLCNILAELWSATMHTATLPHRQCRSSLRPSAGSLACFWQARNPAGSGGCRGADSPVQQYVGPSLLIRLQSSGTGARTLLSRRGHAAGRGYRGVRRPPAMQAVAQGTRLPGPGLFLSTASGPSSIPLPESFRWALGPCGPPAGARAARARWSAPSTRMRHAAGTRCPR